MDLAKIKVSTPIRVRVKSKRRPGIPVLRGRREIVLEKPEDVPGLIQGRTPGSIPEWNVARALNALGFEYDYQVPLRGGWSRRGGMILDFLVHTDPVWTPVPVNGRHWHNEWLERYEITEMMAALAAEGYAVCDPLVVWEENAITYDEAYAFLASKLGRG